MTPLEIAHKMFALIDSGDWAGVAALAADDYVIHEPPVLPFGGAWRGRDALPRLFAHVMHYWDDPQIERVAITGSDAHFIALLRMTVTSKMTGRRFSQSLVEATRCANGKMVETHIHYFDPDEVAREAGPARER
jgi:ketosteroid isomerase-like protein